MELIWVIVSVVTPLFVGTGITFAMSDSSPGEFLFAKGCFVFSSLLLLVWTLFWLFQTESGSVHRVIVGCLVGALVVSGVPESLRWVGLRQKRQNAEKIEAQLGVSSNNLDYKTLLLEAVKSPNPTATILESLAKSPTPSAVVGKPDLRADSIALENITTKKAAQEALDSMPYTPVLDHIVKTFSDYVSELGAQNGDVFYSEYKGPANGIVASPRLQFRCGLKGNSTWNFYFDVYAAASQGIVEITTDFRGNTANFQIDLRQKKITSNFFEPGRILFTSTSSTDSYEADLDKCLRLLLAAENKRFPLKQIPTHK
jgi:hypothetical protein